jgi:O-antigen/teichoic acid export membrane protein
MRDGRLSLEAAVPRLQEFTVSVTPSKPIPLAPSKALRRRLLLGTAASGLSPVVTACIQLGPVPILLHAWGAAKYGDWLLLWALPGYLSLSDLGFGSASGNDMTVRVAAGDREGALRTFQSSCVLFAITSIATLLIISQVIGRMPWQSWLNLSGVSNHEASLVILTLGAYMMVSQQGGIFEAGYRCDGNYATGMFWVTMLRLIEAIISTAVAVISAGSLLKVAIAYLAVRTLGTVAYAARLRQLSPWLKFGCRHAHFRRVRELFVPALGFIALPIGNALSFQGLTVVVGSVLGPQTLVMFSTMRTLSRVGCQLLTAVARAILPEVSAAFGGGNLPLARRLHRNACQIGMALSILAALFLWILGPYVHRLWVGPGVTFDRTCFDILLVGVLANSLWQASSIIPMSTNVHHHMAIAYLLGSASSLALARALLHPFGIAGAATAALLCDVGMCFFVVPIALRQVDDTLKEFACAMFRSNQGSHPIVEYAQSAADSTP